MPEEFSKSTNDDDQLIRNTADSIRVDVFDLANEEERKDPSLHYKDSIHIKKKKESDSENNTTATTSVAQ